MAGAQHALRGARVPLETTGAKDNVPRAAGSTQAYFRCIESFGRIYTLICPKDQRFLNHNRESN